MTSLISYGKRRPDSKDELLSPGGGGEGNDLNDFSGRTTEGGVRSPICVGGCWVSTWAEPLIILISMPCGACQTGGGNQMVYGHMDFWSSQPRARSQDGDLCRLFCRDRSREVGILLLYCTVWMALLSERARSMRHDGFLRIWLSSVSCLSSRFRTPKT